MSLLRTAMMMVAIAACGGGTKLGKPQPPPGEGGPTEMESEKQPGGTEAGSAQPTAKVDHDADGIADAVDRCPDDAEDADGFQDDDGCPDPDNDADGVPDPADQCPNDKENKNGTRDDDGCPE